MAARRETAGPAPSQTPVGADSISARFAAAQGPAGGINPSPTNHGRPSAKRAKRGPAVISGLCRGRCLHCARRRVSEANRATGPALRPEIVPRGLWRRKVPREGHGPPLQTVANTRPNGKGTRPRTAVGRDALIPPHPAVTGTPAGGINPSPTNHGEHPTKREGHTPPGGRRAGCPHPAAPRGGGNTRGRDKSLPYKPWRTPGQMAPPPAAAFTAAGGVPFYGVVVTGNVKTVIRRPAALRGPARRCGS